MNHLDNVKAIADIKHYYCEVKGATPLVWNKKLSEADLGDVKRTPEQVERELWRKKLHYREDLGLFHPGDGLVKSLIAGAKQWGKKIPGKKSKQYSSELQSSITNISDFVVLSPVGKRLTPDSPEVKSYPRYVTKKDGGQVFVITPIVNDWTARFALTTHNPEFTGVVWATIIKYAGLYNGIGSWWKKFGRFEPTSLKEVDSDVYNRI
jgi:hypothetical protein